MIPESQVYDALDEIFSDLFMRKVTLTPQLKASDVSGWDSFRQIEIVMAAAERFKMKFTSAELDRLTNLGDLAAIIAQRGRL